MQDQPLEKYGQDRARELYLLEAPTVFFEPQELRETLLALRDAKVQVFLEGGTAILRSAGV